MRVPIPIVLLLCLSLAAGLWYLGTHHLNFLNAPDEAELAKVRIRTQLSLSEMEHPDRSAAAVADTGELPSAQPQAPPVIINRESILPAHLDEYSSLCPEGASFLIDLAVLLESDARLQRSLLAWERVIDCGRPDKSQKTTATTAIKRLRSELPDWNTARSRAIPVVLHASSKTKTSRALTSALETAARDLEQASSGILKVTTDLAPSQSKTTSSHPMITVWLTGPAKNSRTTGTHTFSNRSSSTLDTEIRRVLFHLVADHLARESAAHLPLPVTDPTPPLELLSTHITRQSWLELGFLLNQHP